MPFGLFLMIAFSFVVYRRARSVGRRPWLWVLLLSSGVAPAGDPPAPDHAAVARRAWAVTDLVAAHHVQPPPRADLLRAGVTALFERLFHGLEDRFDGHLGLGFGDAGAVHYLVDDVQLNQNSLLTQHGGCSFPHQSTT